MRYRCEIGSGQALGVKWPKRAEDASMPSSLLLALDLVTHFDPTDYALAIALLLTFQRGRT
jgi:hypothetical protein